MDNKRPKVSIITPCFNSATTITDTLQSVMKQDYREIEHIIVDGLSTDGTLSILNEYSQKAQYPVKIISGHDDGIYDAMNKGIRQAKGDLIGIINSDDWYEDGAISKVIDACRNDKYEILYGALKIYSRGKIKSIDFYSHEFLLEKMICHPTCFVSRAIYDELGLFDTKFKLSADYDWMLKMFFNDQVVFNPIFETIACMRAGGKSNSRGGFRETLMLRKKYGQISKLYYWLYLIKSYLGDLVNWCKKIIHSA